MDNENNCYLYAYLRPQDDEHGPAGTPYYIGKGKGNTAFNRNRRNVEVPADRRYIVLLGWNLTKEQAVAAQERLIWYYGRIETGAGCLHNRTNGGKGASARTVSAETRRKLSEIAIFNWSQREIDVSQLSR